MCLSTTLVVLHSPILFHLMNRRPLRSTLFPYTTLFRSLQPYGQSLNNDRLLAAGGTVRLSLTICPLLFGTKIFRDRKSTRLNSSHLGISYAVFCLKKKSNHNFERELEGGGHCDRRRVGQ